MKEDFSQKYNFVNNVGNHLLEVDMSSYETFRNEFKSNKNIDVILIAEPGGRTKGAMQVGLCELPPRKKNIHFEDPIKQPSFPGKTTYDALPDLEKRYDKILILTGSQSGTKTTVCSEVERVSEYLENNGSEKVKMLFVTGNPDSETGKIVKKHDGIILKLKGIEDMDPDDYKSVGVLGDLFENEVASLLQETTEIICNDLEAEEFYGMVERDFKKIGRKFDENSSSIFFKNLTQDTANRSNVFLSGFAGGGLLVSETADVRWGHYKRLIRGNSYVLCGDHSTPPPLPGDVCTWTSFSGAKQIYPGAVGEKHIIDLCRKSIKRGAKTYSIVGTANSPLQEIASKDHTLLLKGKKPSRFYVDALLSHSIAIIKGVNTLLERGILEEYSAKRMKEEHQIG